MAGANRIPYIIDIEASFDKFRKQMKSGEAFSKGDIQAFNSLMTKVLKSVNAEASQVGVNLQNGLKVDTTDLEKKLQLISGIFDEMGKAKNPISDWAEKGKSVYREFNNLQTSVATLAQNINTVQVGLNNLTSSFESFSNAYKSFDPAKLNNIIKPIEGIDVTVNQMKNAGKQANKYAKDIKNLQESLTGLSNTNVNIKFNSKTAEKDFGEAVAQLEGIDDTIDRLHKKMSGGSELSSEEYNKTSIEYAKAIAKRAQLYQKMDSINKKYAKKGGESLFDIEGIVEDPNDIIKEAQGIINDTIQNLNRKSSKVINKGLQAGVPVGVDFKIPSEKDLVTIINTCIDNINSSKSLHKIKLDLDDVANVIEDKTKRAYGDNPADDDVNTTDLINKTNQRFIQVAKTIGKKQKGILKNTQKWRQEMIQAMKIGSDELQFNFGWDKHLNDAADSLFNKLQAYFEQPENALNLYFDTKNIAKNLKAELNAEGITLGGGGGTTTLDANSLAQALYSVLLGKIPSDFSLNNKVVNENSNTVPSNLDKKTDEATESGEEYVKVLDETTIHIDKVIESLREFAKVATKSNASKGSKAIATKLYDIGAKRNKETGEIERVGIDIASIANGATDAEIIQMLQTSLMSKDIMGKPKGGSISGELKSMMTSYNMNPEKGAGKIVDMLAQNITELFDINDIETELVSQVEKRLNQLNLWKGIEKSGRALASLGKVRSTKNRIKIPSVEDIDEAIEYFKKAGENTDALDELRKAKVKLEDNNTDEAKQEFEKSALAFYDKTKSVFNRLSAKWGDFRGIVQAEDHKPVKINPRGAYPYKVLDIPENSIVVKVEPFEAFDIVDNGGVGSTSRKKSSKKKAEQQQKQMNRGSSQSNIFVDKPQPKKDVRNEEIKFDKFKPDEYNRISSISQAQSDLEYLEEQANKLSELTKLVNDGQKTVEILNETKNQIESEIAQMRGENLQNVDLKKFKQYDKSKTNISNIINNAKDALNTNQGLNIGDTSELNQVQSLMVNNLQRIVKNIHDDSVESQELGDKIAEIVEAKKLTKKELEQERAKAAESRDETKANFYRDLIFDKSSVDKKLSVYETKKSEIDERIDKNKNNAQDLISKLTEQNNENTTQAIKEAEIIATQLIEVKDKLYAEASAYVKILNSSNIDDNTRRITLGKLQQTLKKIDTTQFQFATIQPYVPQMAFYDSSQQKNINNWNNDYTNNEVLKLQRNLQYLESQLTKETDQEEIKKLKKQIATTKGLITKKSKNVPDDIVKKEQDKLSNINEKLLKEEKALKNNEYKKDLSEKASNDYQRKKSDLDFLVKYNELLDREKSLLEEINRLKKEGANESVISQKSEELKQATKETDNFLKANNTDERKSYAREKAVGYKAQLSIAYRQRAAYDKAIKEAEDKENSINKYGMVGKTGASALRETKSYAIDEFKNSDYMKSFDEQFRLKTQMEKAQLAYEQANDRYYSAKNKQWDYNANSKEHEMWANIADKADEEVELAEQKIQEIRNKLKSSGKNNIIDKLNALTEEFNNKIATHMSIEDINNPDKIRTFLRDDEIGQKIAIDYQTKEKAIWDEYFDNLRQQKENALKKFKLGLNPENGVLKGIFKTQNEDGIWEDVVKTYDIKETTLKQIAAKKAEAEKGRKPIDDIIKELETEKKAAMRYGNIDNDDLKYDERLKEIENLNNKIEEKNQEIKRLEDELDGIESDDSLDEKSKKSKAKKKKNEIAALNQERDNLEARVQNRVELIAQKKEESKKTPEEKIADATEKLNDRKARLAQIEETIAKYRKDYETSKGTEDELKNLELLNNAIAKRNELQGKIEASEKNIQKWNKEVEIKKSTSGSINEDSILPNGGIVGSIMSVVKEFMDGVGGQIDTTDLAKETTLNAILEVLGGVPQTVNDGHGLRRRDKKTNDNAKSLYKTWNVKPQDLDFDTVKTKAVALKQVIDTLYDKGKSDTEEFINAQTELSKLLSAWRNKIGKSTNPELYGKAGKENWISYLTSGNTKIFDNLDNVELSSISQKDYLSRLKNIGVNASNTKTEIKESEANLQIKDFDDFKLQVRSLKQAIELQKVGSEEQKKLQADLVQVLQAWARNEASGFGGKLPNAKGWESYLISSGVFDSVDTSITPLTNRQLNKSSKTKSVTAKKSVKQKTDTPKKTESYVNTTQSENRQATGGLLQLVAQLAQENTLLQVLSALQTIGTVEGGKPAPTTAGDLYNQFKALLFGSSIDDYERLAYMNSKEGWISGSVIGNIVNISEELIQSLRAKYPNAQGFDTQIHTHGKSSNPYFSTEDYQHFTSDYESGIKKQVLLTQDNISVLDLTAVKSAEEVQNLMNELIKAGSDAKAIKKVFEANNSGAIFETSKFSGLNANSLVKMLGANNAGSDDAMTEINAMISKLQAARKTMAQAVDIGYLSKNDANLAELDNILTRTNEISESIQNGATSYEAQKSELDQLINSAIRYSDVIDSTISKNKRAYVSVGEVDSVNKQKNKIVSMFDSEDEFNNSDSLMIQNYINKVNELNKSYENLIKTQSIQDENARKDLQIQASQAQATGKRLISSISEADKLKQLSDESGTYFDRFGNAHELGGISEKLSTSEVGNLESTMRDYVQNTLKQANIENIKFDNTHKRLTYTFRTSEDTVSDMVIQYNEATNALYAYNKQERESLTGIPAFIQGFKSKLKSITQYMFSITSITRVWGEIRQGITYVKEIDSALTELKKVTDETEQTYDRFLNTASKTGAIIGSTISDFTRATATFAKLGYNIDIASNMAEAALVYQNVGDEIESADAAAESIISTMKGFGMEASESMEIVDRFNEVGNRFSITSKGIGDALQRSASALNEGGNSLDESIGLITAANSVVQDPESVGTALKTLTLRLRGSKTELEEMGEDITDMATTTSSLQKKLLALSHGKVNIMEGADTYKNTTEILREMASAWGEMTDIERSSALELMGGKRQANILSAIIQNFDIVENAIEASSDSAGSALQENEKYLDSIEGKITQFTNSIQTMWNNLLNSDVIKFFVGIGTELVKVIDKIGVLKTALLAFGAYKGFGAIFNILKDSGLTLTALSAKLNAYAFGIQAVTTSEKVLTQEEAVALLTKQGLTDENAKAIITETGLGVSTDRLTKETLEAAMATKGYSEERIKATSSEIFGTQATNQSIVAMMKQNMQRKLQNSTLVQYAIKMGLVEAATVAEMTTTQLLTLSIKTLGIAIKNLWLALGPVGWAIIGITAALTAGIVIYNAVYKTTKELAEELDDLRSELESTKSEIESLNSELETTRDKIAELEARPSLSLTDQDELKRLKQQNVELERQLKIQEALAKSTEEKIVNRSEEYIGKAWNSNDIDKSYTIDSDGVISEDRWYTEGTNTTDALNTAISKYKQQQQIVDDYKKLIANWDSNKKVQDDFGTFFLYSELRDIDDAKNGLDTAEKRLQDISDGINLVFADENFTNLEYGMSDEIDGFLDELYAYQLKWQAAQGLYVKSDAISSIFDSTSTEEIQNLGKQLREIADNDTLTDEQKNKQIQDRINNINMTNEAYGRLKTTMETVGVTAEDIADYFVLETGAFDSSTIEGITAQYRQAERVMNALKGISNNTFTFDGEQYNWEDFFSKDSEGKFKAQADKFSEILKRMDNDARENFMNIVETAANSAGDLSKIDWDHAFSQLTFSSLDKTLEVLNNEFETINNEMFKGAADDISGLIDTVGELKSALEDVTSSMDLVHTAQTQMNSSGRISVKTALELMESTENWDDILTITNGTIKLADNAEQTLIQTKLTAIKTQLQYAWQTAQTKYEVAKASQTELDYADNDNVVMTAESIKAEAIGRVSAVVVALGAAMDKIMNGEWGSAFSAFGDTYKSATATVVADSQRLTSSIDQLKKDAEDKKKMYDAFSNIDDVSSYKNYWDYDKTPGDKYKDDGTSDALEKLKKKYEHQLSNLENQKTYVQNEIDRLEAEDKGVSKSYYEKQIAIEQKKIDVYKQERAALTNLLNSTKKGTDEWYEIANAIWETEHGIQSCATEMANLRKEIVELYQTVFDKMESAFGNMENLFSDRQSYIEKYMELLELQNEAKPASAYTDLIAQEEKKLANYEQELKNLIRIRDNAVASGYLKEGSDEWIQMTDAIREQEAAVLDSKVAIAQYNDELKQLHVEAFEMVRDAFDARGDFYSAQQDYIEGYIDQLDAMNVDVPEEVYRDLIDIEKKKQENLQANIIDARQGLADLEAAGYTAADEEWQNANNRIIEYEAQQQESITKTIEWNNAIRELDFTKFDRFIEKLQDLNSELDNVYKLTSRKDVANEDGTWTEDGLTSLATMYQQYELSKGQVKAYGEEIERLKEAYARGEMSENTYNERLKELTDGQWDAIQTSEDLKYSIIDMCEARVDLIEDGIQKEIEAYEELIELKKEELSAERDLYDFKKDVERQTKDIAELERKIASLSGADDAASIAERRKLEAQLLEAREDLDTSYRNHSLDAQADALDKELEAYQDASDEYIKSLRENLKDVEGMFESTMIEVFNNADIILQNFNKISAEYGITLTDNLKAPWVKLSEQATVTKNDIDTMLDSTEVSIGVFKTSVNSTIDELYTRMQQTSSDFTAYLSDPYNKVTASGGPINTFSTKTESALTNAVYKAQSTANEMTTSNTKPWNDGVTAINTWSKSVESGYNKAIQKAKEYEAAANRAQNVSTPSYYSGTSSGSSGGKSGSNGGNGKTMHKNGTSTAFTYYPSNKLSSGEYGTEIVSINGVSYLHSRSYNSKTKKVVNDYYKVSDLTTGRDTYGKKRRWYHGDSGVTKYAYYAKGTLGTKKDQWAITDEPQFGDELTLVPTKQGNLSYMRKGTSVVPAAITEELLKLADVGVDGLTMPKFDSGINIVTNAISKPEFNFSFDSMVHVDHCDEGTIKDLEKMVDTKINQFTRQMNYAIRKFK